MQGQARGSCLQAADLAALADDVVVQQREMPDLPGESGFPVVRLPVQDHTHSQAPADIDEEHVLLIAGHSADVFPVGHRPGVVLYVYRGFEPVFEHRRQRLVLAHEI